MLGILPEYRVHYLGIRKTSLKQLIYPRKRLCFWTWSPAWQAGKQTSIYKATLRKVSGINNSEKTLSCLFGEHTLKCKSLFFFYRKHNILNTRYCAIESNNFHSFSSPYFFSSLSVYFIISHVQLIDSPDTQVQHFVTQKVILFVKNSLPYPKLTGVPAP